VILAWPLLVVVAAGLAWTRRGMAGGRGALWFALWLLAGLLMSFSLVTGLSIGLFVLPFAAATLIWVATRSPHLVEASGFIAGIAATVLLILEINL
jgi:hypothetical protein